MLSLSQIEYYLNRGDFMGFSMQTEPDYIGWISLKKRKHNKRIEEVFSINERPDLVLEQQQILAYPYVLEICELKKDVYENEEKLPEASDYKRADVLYFSELTDVKEYLRKFDKNLEEIKWMSEIPSF